MQGLPKGTAEAAYEIRLSNAKREKVSVEIIETMLGERCVLSKFLPHDCDNGRRTKWQIKVPAEGQAVLQYRVRVKFSSDQVQSSIPLVPRNAVALSWIQPRSVGQCQTRLRFSRGGTVRNLFAAIRQRKLFWRRDRFRFAVDHRIYLVFDHLESR
jgi:hypothetical protein